MPDPSPLPPRVSVVEANRCLYRIVDLGDRNAEDVYALGLPDARAKAEWILDTLASDAAVDGDHDLGSALTALSRVAEVMPVEGEALSVTLLGSRGVVSAGVRVSRISTARIGDLLAVPAVALGLDGHDDDLYVFEPGDVVDLLAYGDTMTVADALSGEALL